MFLGDCSVLLAYCGLVAAEISRCQYVPKSTASVATLTDAIEGATDQFNSQKRHLMEASEAEEALETILIVSLGSSLPVNFTSRLLTNSLALKAQH